MSKNKQQFGFQKVWPPWTDLPVEITANILQRLDAVEILESAQKVCTTWRQVCQDPAMWRVIRITHYDSRNKQIDAMCRHAVDRSQGQLVDLRIQDFGDNDLLNYIAHRSSELKRLTLHGRPYKLSGKHLVEAVKKLPHLEELQLIIMESAQTADIMNIGISCPFLKSFTFNQHGYSYPDVEQGFDESNYNEYALAIANNMPNLRQLRLIGNSIDNKGLEAVLDGCPKLESLDLRQCYDLDLQGALGKRCREQIKRFKFPWDDVSFTEYESAPKYLDLKFVSCSDIEYVEDDGSCIGIF